jgi:o-succinylbenzoate synthase
MNEAFAITYETYARPFRQPLLTSHGLWAVRSGAIMTLRSGDGRTAQGEIAPLEWFGSESLADAIEFCVGLNGQITREEIFAISDRLPCCQFAFEMALRGLEADGGDHNLRHSSEIAALLPTGKAAIAAWKSLHETGSRTFKWKIGVGAIEDEIALFRDLYQQLPGDCKLRLDANAGLDLVQAKRWLDCLEDDAIEYLEQPLDVRSFDQMKVLGESYSTMLALDESISNLASLVDCYEKGWRGVYVIKPAIVGSPKRLQEFMQRCPMVSDRSKSIDVVFSSVFETSVGYEAGLHLGMALGCERALGYGTQDWW